MLNRIAICSLLLGGLSSALATLAIAQALPSKTVATSEGNILIPVASAPLGKMDAAALDELTKHLTVVGQASWISMRAKGSLTHGSNEGSGSEVVLSVHGAREYRLDVQATDGVSSTRIQNAIGKIKDGDGKLSVIPPDTASLGLFPFVKLRALNRSGASTALLDGGTVTIGGQLLHRITYEFAGTEYDPATHARKVLAIDFYLDPATHLLVKSAAWGQFPESGPTHFLFVVTYSDYRRVGDSMIPYHYSETVDGSPYRSLQISDVQLNPAFDATYFHF